MSASDEVTVLTAEVERLKAGREIERDMIRNAIQQIGSLEDALRDAWAYIREVDDNT